MNNNISLLAAITGFLRKVKVRVLFIQGKHAVDFKVRVIINAKKVKPSKCSGRLNNFLTTAHIKMQTNVKKGNKSLNICCQNQQNKTNKIDI